MERDEGAGLRGYRKVIAGRFQHIMNYLSLILFILHPFDRR